MSLSLGFNLRDDVCVVLPPAHVGSSKLDHVISDDSIGDSSSDDNELELGKADLFEIGAPYGLISLGRLVPTWFVKLVPL